MHPTFFFYNSYSLYLVLNRAFYQYIFNFWDVYQFYKNNLSKGIHLNSKSNTFNMHTYTSQVALHYYTLLYFGICSSCYCYFLAYRQELIQLCALPQLSITYGTLWVLFLWVVSLLGLVEYLIYKVGTLALVQLGSLAHICLFFVNGYITYKQSTLQYFTIFMTACTFIMCNGFMCIHILRKFRRSSRSLSLKFIGILSLFIGYLLLVLMTAYTHIQLYDTYSLITYCISITLGVFIYTMYLFRDNKHLLI